MNFFPTTARELIGRLEEIVDELIGYEREEQEAILKRQTATLPDICGRIDQQTVELGKVQLALAPFWPKPDALPELAEPGMRTFEKLKNLQQLTIQNHLLLEHHLNFLQEIHRGVLGVERKSFLYNGSGVMPGEWADSGTLLNTSV